MVEEILLDVMYELPSRSDVRKCIVSGESVVTGQRPLLVTESGQAVDITRPQQQEDEGEDEVPESA